jgi:TP901 family phage tail tape measure protein
MSKRLDRLNRGMNRIGGAAKRGALVAGAAFTGLGVVIGGMIKTGMQFEQTITNAAAKFPGQIRKGTEAFKQLEAAAAKVGAETEFTASQSAEALNFLAMAGFNAEQAIAALPGVVDLATAAQVDLGTATDIATDSLGAFGLATKDPIQGAKNLARVNDVLAKTSTTANTSIEDLFEAVKDAAPVATAAGQSLETFGALAGTMANAGIKGSKAGTTLKNTFLALSAPTGKAAAALKNLNVKTVDSQGNMRDSITILGELKTALQDKGTAERAAALDAIFGKRAIAGVNVLLDAGEEQLRAYRTQLENSGGAAKDMAATMRGTTQGSLNSLKSAVEGVSIALFQQTKGPLKEAIDSATKWTRANKDVIGTKLGDFVEGVGTALAFLIKFRKPIGILIGVLATLVIGLKIFTAVMTAVNLVMAANPIVLIVLAVLALTAVFVGIIVYMTKFKDKFNELGAVAQTAISVILVAIGSIFGPIGIIIALVVIIRAKWGVLGPFFQRLWASIKAFFIATWEFIKAIPGRVADFFISVWEGIPGFFAAVWEGVKMVFSAALDALILMLVAPFVIMVELWKRGPEIFAAIWEGIKTLFAAAWEALTGFMQAAWDGLVALWEGLPEFFAGLWELLKAGVTAYINFYLSIFQFAWDTMVAVWNGIPGFFTGLWEGIKAVWAAVPGFFTGLWDSIVAGVKSAFSAALAFVQSIINRVMGKVAMVQNAVAKVTGFLGIGGSEGNAGGAQVATSSARTARSISESTTTNTSQVVIQDRTGRASAPGGLGPGVTLQPSGGF